MFNQKPKPEQAMTPTPAHEPMSSNTVNIIGPGTVIEGEIKSNGDLRIDGKIIGAVNSKAKVVIGNTGVVEGDVICQNADISGNIKGKTTVNETLFLKSTAKVNGDIITGKLVVEVGASFTGNCNMGNVKEMSSYGDKPAQQQQLKEKTA
jgi:cytoskeletal protein CcmA (bactofilin family)